MRHPVRHVVKIFFFQKTPGVRQAMGRNCVWFERVGSCSKYGNLDIVDSERSLWKMNATPVLDIIWLDKKPEAPTY